MIARLIATLCLTLALAGPTLAGQLRFSGYDFRSKAGTAQSPGPNDWADSQAFVDGQGRLHLKFSEIDGQWVAAEIQSVSAFGFGTYEIEFDGDISGLDRNVVFGFFSHPEADVGPEGTNEIDLAFTRWGVQSNKPLNYLVWPVKKGLKPAFRTVGFHIDPGTSIHRFLRKKDRVIFYSLEVKENGDYGKDVTWSYRPNDYKKQISTGKMPVRFNLWGFRGKPPSDGKPVEVIVNHFKFTPAP